MVELLTYSLEFRGDVSRNGNAVAVRAYAPSCTHETRLGGDGIAARFLFDDEPRRRSSRLGSSSTATSPSP
jgi:hypothetical protein